MSTIHQYLVRDELSDSDSPSLYETASGWQDPYAHHVVLYKDPSLYGPQYTPPLNGVTFAEINSGFSASPAHLLSPGKKDFCVEMFFRLPGTYGSWLFDELSALSQHPIFYLRTNANVFGDPGIFVYIDNDYYPNNVGLNGLGIVFVDVNGESRNVYISPTNFLNWLNSGSQYKGLSFGRRGKYFFKRYFRVCGFGRRWSRRAG